MIVLPDWSGLGLFVVAALVLLITPGPAVLYIVTRSIDQGRRAGLVSMLGVHVGTLVHVAAAAVGLSAVLVASATAFTAVKWLGAAYLVYLGVRRILDRTVTGSVASGRPRRLRRAFLDGVVGNTLNPKTALFSSRSCRSSSISRAAVRARRSSGSACSSCCWARSPTAPTRSARARRRAGCAAGRGSSPASAGFPAACTSDWVWWPPSRAAAASERPDRELAALRDRLRQGEAMSHLRDKYCIVGVGETEYSRGSGRSTRAMAVEAIRKAILDAGLKASDVDGMLDYQGGDSTLAPHVAPDLGIRLNFYMDVMGGGSSTEALVGLAMGAIEAGMCNTVAIYRSMNGYSEFRIGGTGARAAQPVRGLDLAQVPYGMRSAGQNFAPTFMRHMYDYGTTSEQVAHVKVAHSKHASQNPKALLKERVTVQDVVNSRWICKPLHLLDCCLETDNATCVIVTSAERARDMRQRPIHILGVAGRVSKPRLDFHWAHGPISRVAGYYAKDIIFPQAGIRPEDVSVTGSYDAFTFTTMLQLEEYGFCKKGEGGQYVSSGIIELGGKRPNNTSGGHLCEGYTHGMSMVIENVRQLRGTVDDYCPKGTEGVHTYDYSPGRCRQVKDATITMNLGWAMPPLGSALIMRR